MKGNIFKTKVNIIINEVNKSMIKVIKIISKVGIIIN